MAVPTFWTFDPTRLTKIIEGKTKIVFNIPNENLDEEFVLVRSKDQITAFNAERKHVLDGKAQLSNLTNCKVFNFLAAVGLKTHFVKQYSETEFIAERCHMIPIEWVTRRIATGSFLKRNPGVKEGYRFSPPKLELFYKDDAAGDPQWSEEMLTESEMKIGAVKIGEKEVEMMSQTTVTVFEVLEKAWARLGCTLVDMKIEFGVNCQGEIVLGDVIDSDSWRLWPAGDRRLQVDKQFYRDLPAEGITPDALGQLKKNFQWVSEKLEEFIAKPSGRVVVIMGSATDETRGKAIQKACQNLGIPTFLRVASAHKGTKETLKSVAEYEGDHIPTVFVAVAGRSNGLGPVISGNTCYPVINCPPVSDLWGVYDIFSSLRTPSGIGCSTVLSPEAAALSAASSLSLSDHMVWCRLRIKQLYNHKTLMKADLDAQVEEKKESSEACMNGVP